MTKTGLATEDNLQVYVCIYVLVAESYLVTPILVDCKRILYCLQER